MSKALGFRGTVTNKVGTPTGGVLTTVENFTDPKAWEAAVLPLEPWKRGEGTEGRVKCPPMPRLRKRHAQTFRPFPEPAEYDRGAGVSIQLVGGGLTSTEALVVVLSVGQVWDDAPNGGVWLATGERYLWVHKGTGLAYTPEAATTSTRNRKSYLVGMVTS